MKKIFVIMILGLMLVFTGCAEEYQPVDQISVILPSGTPQLALGTLMVSDNQIEAVTNTDLLRTALMQNTHDIVIAPLTMGATLAMNERTTYKLAAIITINNTYLVSQKSLTQISDVSGGSIVAYQESAAPGIILKMALAQANVTATVQYEANVNAARTAYASGEFDYCLLAEPQLTQLENSTSINVLNLSTLFNTFIEFMPQAAIYVRESSVESKDVEYFLGKLEENINKLNTNPTQYASELVNCDVAYFNTLTEEVIAKSAPRANIVYYEASKYKEVINDYFDLMNQYNNNQFGDWTPSESFYK